ncbi:hypothetical protein TR13x_10675 [Caloranaerobacter sp. TR13]|uniref:hypothetical protein n=1 Tax=Caloranaerobacter sp. TR13 TaxID=1302151 RepID=UPI0006D3ED29|nr:hypothetical protein [Caloranaerobacter sp. TR13]KPU26321.1 hypothetical protein TR13x_10675 [Caloranaerobacter sp. TR13]
MEFLKTRIGIIFCLIALITVSMSISSCSIHTEIFYSLEEAEAKIGEINLPNMPDEYSIRKIEYTDDGFTVPQTAIYYQNSTKHEIIFLTASDIEGELIYEDVDSKSISNIKWIIDYGGNYSLFKNKFVLKWRKSNNTKFKYFITSSKEDKDWLIRVAEEFND